MPVLLAQVAFAHDSGQPRDAAVNTFHFDATASVQATYDALDLALQSFYEDPSPPQSFSISDELSLALTGLYRIKIYDLADAIPRPTRAVYDHVTTVGTDGLPEEVAICLSYQADTLAGQPQAQRRGRIFIGPLRTAVMDNLGNINPNMQEVWGRAAQRLVTDSAATAAPWVVRHRATGSVATITNGWVDNEFDTQRRRGQRATDRELWPWV